MSLHKAINLSDVKRREADFYATPADVTRALLGAEREHMPQHVWEPAAGDGAMADVLAFDGGRDVSCSDAIARGRGFRVRSFYDYAAMDKPAPAVVTNPPFADCAGKMQWLWHAYRIGLEYMALLLPAMWPYARGRRELLAAWRPAREWKIGWRIDWSGGGSSPADHSWFVWDAAAPTADTWTTGVLYRDSIETQPTLFAEASS